MAKSYILLAASTPLIRAVAPVVEQLEGRAYFTYTLVETATSPVADFNAPGAAVELYEAGRVINSPTASSFEPTEKLGIFGVGGSEALTLWGPTTTTKVINRLDPDPSVKANVDIAVVEFNPQHPFTQVGGRHTASTSLGPILSNSSMSPSGDTVSFDDSGDDATFQSIGPGGGPISISVTGVLRSGESSYGENISNDGNYYDHATGYTVMNDGKPVINYDPKTCPPTLSMATAKPVMYANGAAQLVANDFIDSGPGSIASTLSRQWSNVSNTGDVQNASFGAGTSFAGVPYVVPIQSTAGLSIDGPGHLGILVGGFAYVVITPASTKRIVEGDRTVNKFTPETIYYVFKDRTGHIFAAGGKSESRPTFTETASGTLRATEQDGTITEYSVPLSPTGVGHMTTRQSPSGTGDQTVTDWDTTNDRPNSITHTYTSSVGSTSTTNTEVFEFGYNGATNRVDQVVQKRNGQTIRTVKYEYYGTSNNGPVGSLKRVLQYNGTTDSPVVNTSYYRWYTSDSPTGYTGGLKYFVSDEAYQKISHDKGTSSVDGLTDSDLADYADNYFEYSTSGTTHRVSREIALGAGQGCSCGRTGEGIYDFSYASNTSSTAGVGRNVWSNKTTVTLPDATQDIVYTNAWGEVLLNVKYDTASQKAYSTWAQYDGDGNVIRKAEGKAIAAYNPNSSSSVNSFEQFDDLVGYGQFTYAGAPLTLLASTGRVDVTNYYAAGDDLAVPPVGQLKSVGYQRGDSGAFVPTESWTYTDGGVAGDGVWNVASDTTYPDAANSTVQRVTSYSYDSFWPSDSGNSSQPASVTTSYAKVSGAQNGADSTTGGSSSNYQTKTYYDSTGRVVWSVDGGGYINFYQYDPLTGMKVKEVDDADPAAVSTAAVAGPTRSPSLPPALNLTTLYGTVDSSGHIRPQSDSQGRWTERIDPNGNVTYKVYDDTTADGTPRSVKTYTGWNGSTHQPTGPVWATIDDPSTGIRDTVSYTWSAAGGLPVNGNVPNGTEDFSSGNMHLQSLLREVRNVSDQRVESRQYIDLTGLTYVPDPTTTAWTALGVAGTNYLSTKYKYDAGGRLYQTTTPDGTVTRTLFDARGLALSDWIGTASGTDYDAANNRVMVASYTYDDDGNRLTSTQYPHDGSANRVTKSSYDFRDRLVATQSGVRAVESASDNTDQISYTDYDNLDEPTATYVYDGDTVAVAPGSDGVPVKPSATLLRAESATQYDDQGRIFAEHQYSVDPATGGVSSSAIDTNDWYDPRGNLIKTQTSGSAVMKMSFDGAVREIARYTTDGGGDSTYADAGNVTGDTVVDQLNTTYDAAGNVILTMQKRRFHDATGTGALGRPTSGVRARLYYVPSWYDAANRLIGSAEIGTNFGTDYTRGNAVPARSDTKLVTTYAYDAAGRLSATTDPRGLVAATYYDLAGRTTKTVADYVDGTPSDADDQTTAYAYDGDGNVLTETAVLPGNAFQTTKFIYGASQSRGDGVDDADTLVATQYPDPTTGSPAAGQQETYTTNALGDRTGLTDRNGTTHTYGYDVLGRKTLDGVTTLGPGVDGAVRAIGWTYNTQGLVDKTTSYADTAATGVVNEVEDTYNGLGQVAAEYQNHAGGVDTATTPKVLYAYADLAHGSRPTGMTYPNGRALTYTYAAGLDNAVGRLSSIADASGTLEAYQYLGMDTVVVRSHPQTGVSLSYVRASSSQPTGDGGDQYTGLDRFNRVADQKWVNASGVVVDEFKYAYDRDGNVVDKPDLTYAVLNKTYTYDGLNRLVSNTRDADPGQAWALDALGNMKSVTDAHGVTVSRTNNSQNQLTATGGLTYVYDADGNQVSQSAACDFNHDGAINLADYYIYDDNYHEPGHKTQAQGDANGDGTVDGNDYTLFVQASNQPVPAAVAYVYDAWNRMVSAASGNAGTVTPVAYAYDGLNRRVKDGVGDAYFDTAWQDVEDRTPLGQVSGQQVWSPVYVDAMAEQDRDTDADGTLDQRLYPTQDANWNVTAVLGGTGTVLVRYDYTAYGSRTVFDPATYAVIADPVNFRQGFQGGTYEAALPDLILFRNRTYDTVTMRWVEEDPLGTESYMTQGMNLTQFVRANPVSFSDPNGLQAETLAVNIDVVPSDWSEGWNPFGNYGNYGILAANAVAHLNPNSSTVINCNGVDDMVDQILAYMNAHPGQRLGTLVFRGHGSTKGFYPGPTSATSDAVDNDIVPPCVLKDNPRYSPHNAKKLAELKRFIQGGHIKLEACYAGNNKDMLQALANLTGANVTGGDSSGTWNHIGGTWYTASPGGNLTGQPVNGQQKNKK